MKLQRNWKNIFIMRKLFLLTNSTFIQSKQCFTKWRHLKFAPAFFCTLTLETVLKSFKKKLVLIQAAGGLVHTDDDHLLLISRRGKWDLPKGKLDDNEDIKSCAIREVTEETGLIKVAIERPLCITYHTYHQDGKHILKESHWYLMKAEQQANLIPQLEEGIEKCEWVPIDQVAPYMENTHASILDVVNAGLKLLRETRNV